MEKIQCIFIEIDSMQKILKERKHPKLNFNPLN